MFPPRPNDNPKWQSEEALTFSSSTKMWEGIKQIQCLTNTVVKSSLPTDLAQFQEDNVDVDHFMQR